MQGREKAVVRILWLVAAGICVDAHLSQAQPGRAVSRRLTATRQEEAQAALPYNYLYTGDGTQYSDAVARDGASTHACSFPYLSPWARRYFVAINQDQFELGLRCGACLKVRCVDPVKCLSNEEVTVFVTDLCPYSAGCTTGFLDFSLPAWEKLTGIPPDRVQIAWNFTTCAPLVTKSIIANHMNASSEYWQAFYFSNSKYRLASVALNDTQQLVQLVRHENNFWAHEGLLGPGPYTFTLTTFGGASVNATVSNVLRRNNLKVQFDAWTPEGGQEPDVGYDYASAVRSDATGISQGGHTLGICVPVIIFVACSLLGIL